MHTLYLDLASHDGLIAAVTNDAILASERADHRIDDASLVPRLEKALLSAGWSYQDLTNIACVVGPGGFTSLRVAVALANTLSHELKIPSCGVHLSDVYRARTSAQTSASELTNNALWLHSTKKNELFIRSFGDFAKKFPEPQCITLDELKKVIKEGSQWMGELIPEHRKIVDEAGAQEASLVPIAEVLPSFLKKQTYVKQILQPWYGRGW